MTYIYFSLRLHLDRCQLVELLDEIQSQLNSLHLSVRLCNKQRQLTWARAASRFSISQWINKIASSRAEPRVRTQLQRWSVTIVADGLATVQRLRYQRLQHFGAELAVRQIEHHVAHVMTSNYLQKHSKTIKCFLFIVYNIWKLDFFDYQRS